jgi:serine/threonine protein phosphatase PrpC
LLRSSRSASADYSDGEPEPDFHAPTLAYLWPDTAVAVAGAELTAAEGAIVRVREQHRGYTPSVFAHAVEVVSAGRSGQDRAAVVEREGGAGLLIALADGAGGTGRGATAAQAIIDAAARFVGKKFDATDVLARFDTDLMQLGGQSTAVLVELDASSVHGASVGDSAAWVVHDGKIIDATAHQNRKPLVGDGCTPVSFQVGALAGGTLVVASDGLFRYAKREDIVRLSRDADLRAAARALVDLVRLPNGGFQDDVAIVLCRELR